MPVRLTVEQESLKKLVKKLEEEENGKRFRRDLSKEIRAALEPAKTEAISSLMSIGHSGRTPTEGEGLRAYVAGQIKVEARLTGRASGGRVKVKKGGPRGFEMAARRLNRKKGWRHPVPIPKRRRRDGRHPVPKWVTQTVNPVEWFDEAMRGARDEVRNAVVKAMYAVSKRIAR